MIHQITLAIILSLSLALLSSCQKETYTSGCTDPTADNYDSSAIIDDFSCISPREKFFGRYEVNEICGSTSRSWSLTINQSTMVLQGIVLNNFGDSGTYILAGASGNMLSFNDSETGITYKGTGTLSGNTLTINYTASIGSITQNCTATCIKQ